MRKTINGKREKVSCHTVCPECGSRLSSLDHGYEICFECGWSWSPVVHLNNEALLHTVKVSAAR